jgi:phosphate transport system permease protein
VSLVVEASDESAAREAPGESAGARRRDEKPGRPVVPPSERLIEMALLACGLVSVLTTAGIIGVLAVETVAFFSEVSLGQFFGDTVWTPLFADKRFGIWPLVSGTFLTSAIAIAVALPFGLLAAIYLSEIASGRARRALKPALEVLAGVPSIVYGYFALVVVTPILQRVVPDLAGFNALSPGIVMGIMILPMISSLSEDAIHAVPAALREAAYGLGATRVAVITRVVVPSAFSGIAAAFVLAVARAIGETMVVAIAAGQQPRLTLDPRVPIETLTAYIVQISMGDTPRGTLEYRSIFAAGATLFVMSFVLSALTQRLVRRSRDRGRR